MTEELKPCPFCGSNLIKLENMGWPSVYCIKCGAKVAGMGYAEDGAKSAIKKWNRRQTNEN